MFDGVVLLWFILTGLSFLFVVVDVWKTPESPVLKWGFVILTAFTGPFGTFFYVLGCREPLKGTHEQYVSSTWRQVLGSTMHCASGDGVGIIAGAVIGSFLTLSPVLDTTLEYLLGFGFGWGYFQAFAMRDMAGGSYVRSLKMTFLPEFLSMNVLMGAMVLVMRLTMPHVAGASNPANSAFWFVVSMALLAGAVAAYPMNWWLVTRHIKHGMITVPAQAMAVGDHAGSERGPAQDGGEHGGGHGPTAKAEKTSRAALTGMTLLSVGVFALCLIIVSVVTAN